MNYGQDWLDTARGLAVKFRLGLNVSAALEMVELIEQIVQNRGDIPPSMVDDLGLLLASLVQCQEAHDWLGLADYLDTELVEWVGRVHSCRMTGVKG